MLTPYELLQARFICCVNPSRQNRFRNRFSTKI